jgi:hypothetical protein
MENLSVPVGTVLKWEKGGKYHEEAVIGQPKSGDGVTFSLEYYPTCYRRGQWKLVVEVADGSGHMKWGCFDSQDQPVRYYHHEASARTEAEAIAAVLLKDRAAKA